jgi:hypothetical protein
MENSIKIQEEFENLIYQLERLKKINELTYANTESVQHVIIQTDKFITSTNEFKKKIEEDFTLKSESIDKLIIQLDESIESLNIQSNALTKNINSSFNIWKDETGSNFSSLTNSVTEKFESTQKSVQELKNTLIEKSEKSETKLIEYHNNQVTVIIGKIDETRDISLKKFELISQEIKILKTLIYAICGLILMGIIATLLK